MKRKRIDSICVICYKGYTNCYKVFIVAAKYMAVCHESVYSVHTVCVCVRVRLYFFRSLSLFRPWYDSYTLMVLTCVLHAPIVTWQWTIHNNSKCTNKNKFFKCLNSGVYMRTNVWWFFSALRKVKFFFPLNSQSFEFSNLVC